MARSNRVALVSNAAIRPRCSPKRHGCKTPRRRNVVTPKAPKRSVGPAKPVDGDLSAWSARLASMLTLPPSRPPDLTAPAPRHHRDHARRDQVRTNAGRDRQQIAMAEVEGVAGGARADQ